MRSCRKALIIFLSTGLALVFGSAFAGFAAGDQVQYFPHLVFGGGYSTTWQFTGLGVSTGMVTVEMFAQNGMPLIVPTDLGTNNIFRFTLGASASFSLHTLGSGNSFGVGWAKVTSTQPIGAPETYTLATGSTLISQATVLPSPLVGVATILTSDQSNTALALVDVGSEQTTYSFKLLDRNGTLLGTGTRTLLPYSQSAFYVNQIPGLENVSTQDGSLEVSAPAPFSMVAIQFDGFSFASAPILPGRAASTETRAGLLDKIQALNQELGADIDTFLGPDPSDQAPYASFLGQADTGMTRLVPWELYDSELPINGGGAYYSFATLTHAYGYGSDLGLSREGKLYVGFAGYDFGFITDLGTIAIEGVTIDSPAVSYLKTYVPPTVGSDIRAQQQSAGQGFFVGPYFYRSNFPATAGETYALRSVVYSTSDVLVVFRVLRFDTDGSIVLVWKKLASFAVPHYQ